MGEMIAVENGNDFCTRVKGEEIVEVISLRFRVGNFDYAQAVVLLLHLAKFSLEWLNWLGRVVYEVDAELVSRIYKLVKGIVDLFTWSVHVSWCRRLLYSDSPGP